MKDDALYAIALGWPGESLRLSADLPFDQNSQISLLGSDGEPLEWWRDGGVVTVAMPEAGADATTSQHAYTFKITTPGGCGGDAGWPLVLLAAAGAVAFSRRAQLRRLALAR